MDHDPVADSRLSVLIPLHADAANAAPAFLFTSEQLRNQITPAVRRRPSVFCSSIAPNLQQRLKDTVTPLVIFTDFRATPGGMTCLT
ncbi:hypothetical protein B0G76_2227 [Paraburkholderia sp. BL23I1N1]|nr:hypothetical protein B0G76_2227 [Paraburkholderia sp. BL23I1N1]